MFASAEEIKSFEVGAEDSRRPRGIPAEHLSRGWHLYNAKFNDHLTKWATSELTQEKLAEAILAAALKLRTRSRGLTETLPDFVKEQVPELLADIFALYAILRSGSTCQSVGHAGSDTGDVQAATVQPQEPGWDSKSLHMDRS